MSNDAVFRIYLQDLQRNLATGDDTEHTHRTALMNLIEKLGDSLHVINEPRRIDCGSPDLRVERRDIPVGIIETKDIGKNLDVEQKSEQMKRYLDSLNNLILTDYLEFRWFVNGERRLKANLAIIGRAGKIELLKDGINEVTNLLQEFLSQDVPTIGRPKELAERMAKIAQLIRVAIEKTYDQESETGSLHGQLEAFRETLIPDLKPDQFADMYAQTIAYGLFSAWVPYPDNQRFTRQEAAWNLPKTNPFLQKLFNEIAGVGLDSQIAKWVDDLAYLLHKADKAEVLRDFGKATKQEDPVVHFYETFLKAYDPKMRKARGVYYTPEPVVSYIVRSIDHLLKTKFDKPLGLADKDVMILDPACGTGTFLYFVIKQIYDTLKEKGQLEPWSDYVKMHLLPRIFGFELLMAPYTVAHMKLGLLLKDLGYDFAGDKRLEIYLTNTLDEAIRVSTVSFAKFITDEAKGAAEIKKEKPIMVVLGNPPYSVSSANKGPQIEKLMERYKQAVRGERNIQPLSDDYIKFIRFAHDRIERTGYGIIGMITNNSYLSGLIHRGMREELLKTFDEIYILNLHGDSLIKEISPNGIKDENVFDIRVGVGISLLIKEEKSHEEKVIKYDDIRGLRDGKYQDLFRYDLEAAKWQDLHPIESNFFFVPKNFDIKEEYEKAWNVSEIFKIKSSSINTMRDHFLVSSDVQSLVKKIVFFADKTKTREQVIKELNVKDTRDWKIDESRKDFSFDNNKIVLYGYRPFDMRFFYYDDKLIDRGCSRRSMMINFMEGRNLGLATSKSFPTNREFNSVFVSNKVTDGHFASDRSYIFPLYLYRSSEKDYKNKLLAVDVERELNLSPEFVMAMAGKLGMRFVSDGKGDLEATFGPEDVLHYIYAIFHSPTYRTRYAEFLKIDFPRVPLTSNQQLFRALCQRGEELVSLHLMESPILNTAITTFTGSDRCEIEKVEYVEQTGQVYINKTDYFEGIRREVWEFHIGGYQVLHKWLKDRKGRTLSWDDQQHYQKIVVALTETMRLMKEIDQVIPKWPIE